MLKLDKQQLILLFLIEILDNNQLRDLLTREDFHIYHNLKI